MTNCNVIKINIIFGLFLGCWNKRGQYWFSLQIKLTKQGTIKNWWHMSHLLLPKIVTMGYLLYWIQFVLLFTRRYIEGFFFNNIWTFCHLKIFYCGFFCFYISCFLNKQSAISMHYSKIFSCRFCIILTAPSSNMYHNIQEGRLFKQCFQN